jgi:transcriptional regulator with GAF, ATPase, and Fis domain
VPASVRLISATNLPLRPLVAAGKMRSDFYYRITVIPIQLLPLRRRSVDIPLLVQVFYTVIRSQCNAGSRQRQSR